MPGTTLHAINQTTLALEGTLLVILASMRITGETNLWFIKFQQHDKAQNECLKSQKGFEEFGRIADLEAPTIGLCGKLSVHPATEHCPMFAKSDTTHQARLPLCA